MATFHSSSTNQKDVAPHLYPDSSVPGNLLYLNYSSSGSYPGTLAGTNHSQQNCIQLHIPPTMVSQDSSIGGGDFVSSRLVEHTYNVWREGENEMFMTMNGEDDLVHSSVTVDPLMDLPSHLGILNGQDLSLQQSNVLAMQGQGLSLSLGTQIPVSSFQHQPGSSDICFLSPHQSSSGNDGSCRKDSSAVKHMNSNSPPCGLLSITSSVSNSKYLKAAQQLLDEVVNVWRALKHKADKSQSAHTSTGTASCKDNDGGSKTDENPSNPHESTNNSSVELSPSERQDLQNKVTKLLAMLDEVDQRYKQYYHQMQMVVSSFDAVAGSGAARPYTALALQTISRHFRCLRDAISGHIRTTRKSLGDQDSTLTKGVGISRLRYIDQHLRQQRAMQQFGLMQPHAWRPQRGLPETSVSILRAWLFEHFLHPYPKDSEKLMLARQTGLTRSQVSNWFINARVRLWKPMIEEMYKEETGDVEMDSNSSSENILKSREEMRSPEDREDLQSPISERYLASQYKDSSKSNLIGDMVMGSSFHIGNVEETYNGDERFIAAYHMPELGRYGNEAVSLTLGLQHRDGSNGQQSFLAGRWEEIYGSPPPIVTDASNYEYMNQPHRFGSPHLLHDFVA